jgi:hypothetical protein
LNTVPSEVLFGVYEKKAKRPSFVYCGANAGSKDVAARPIGDVGFEPVDAGPLRIARYAEPFGLLMGQLASKARKGRNSHTGSSDMGEEQDPDTVISIRSSLASDISYVRGGTETVIFQCPVLS